MTMKIFSFFQYKITTNLQLLLQPESNSMLHQASKYNYLQQSFQKENIKFSPPSHNSSRVQSSAHRSNFGQQSIPMPSQFSPYENKAENIEDKILVQELTNHNKVLIQQIDQYRNMIEKLEKEIRLRTEDFASMDILRQKEKELHQQTINEMKGQIEILLLKNSHIEQKNLVLETQLRKFETQMNKSQARVRSLSVVAANSKQNSKLLFQISNLLQTGFKSKKKQKNITKVPNQPLANLELTKYSPRNSAISHNISEQMVFEQISGILHYLQKYEQLMQSIFEMHHKITGKNIKDQPHQLKQIWKWLKQLGHRYTMTEKWKKILMEILGLNEKCNDMSINDVLQKTILELHSK